jgi:hypothetical protein
MKIKLKASHRRIDLSENSVTLLKKGRKSRKRVKQGS